MNWIKETKEIVAKHQERKESMYYTFLTENECYCAICEGYIPKGVERIHFTDGEIVDIFCSDDCYVSSGIYVGFKGVDN